MNLRRLEAASNFDTYAALFEDAFPETEGTSLRSRDHYLWKFGAAGKAGLALEYLASDEEQNYGYYCGLPLAFELNHTPATGGLVCDVMTHSRARGKGVFTALGRFATGDMQTQGIDFCTGFPIRSYVMPGHLKVGWKIAFDLPVFVKLTNPGTLLDRPFKQLFSPLLQGAAGLYNGISHILQPRGSSATVEVSREATSFQTEAYRQLYNKWKVSYPNHMVRSGDFWRWRLSAPQSEYYVITASDRRSMQAIAVCRTSPVRSGVLLSVLEIMVDPDAKGVLTAIHQTLTVLARQLHTAGVAIMLNRADARKHELARHGYFATPIKFKLILKWLSTTRSEPSGFYAPESWHLTWADTDTL